VANKFEFKTQEGHLHGIAETFQALIMLTMIEYKTVKKVRAFVFCWSYNTPDTVGFDKYFQEFFLGLS
jgi:hypothetical protein